METYTHQPYPSVRYHRERDPVTVESHEEHEALGDEWADTPAAFLAQEPEEQPTSKVSRKKK